MKSDDMESQYRLPVVMCNTSLTSQVSTSSSSSGVHREGNKRRKKSGRPSRSLPQDLVLKIGRELVACSLKDAMSMKMMSKAWGRFVGSGPILIVSCPASSKMFFRQIVPADEGAQPALEDVDFLFPPPPRSSLCWGAANGMMALHNDEVNRTFLQCPMCGHEEILAEVPFNMGPKGVYLHEGSPTLVIMELDQDITARLLFLQQFCEADSDADQDIEPSEQDNEEHTELSDAEQENEEDIKLSWGPYPGAESYIGMESVNFSDTMSFIGVTKEANVILDELVRGLGEDMIQIKLDAGDDEYALWKSNGCHVFTCENQVYVCCLLRSRLDETTVRAQVFLLQSLDGHEYRFDPVSNIGQHCVYLGANQAVVMDSVENSVRRRENTLYVEDDDGHYRGFQIIALDIDTQVATLIPFPLDITTELTNQTPAAWVSAWVFPHADTAEERRDERSACCWWGARWRRWS